VPFGLVPFGLVPFSTSAFWQIAKLLNSQNYFSFQGLPIDCKVGAKNKIKTIVDIFFLLISNFSFFLLL